MTPKQIDSLELPCEVVVRARVTYRSADGERVEVTLRTANLPAQVWVHAEDVLPMPEVEP